MKQIKILSIILFFTISILEIGCKGDAGTQGPIGPPGPSLTGNISGLVTLTDTNGVQPTNRSGVTISIPGTSYTTLTDSTGKWTLSNVTTGTYEIDVSKNTYGSTKHTMYTTKIYMIFSNSPDL